MTFEGRRILIDCVMHGRISEVREQPMRRDFVEDFGKVVGIGFVAFDNLRGLSLVIVLNLE